ncbi:MAG: YigZ family protein [Pseudomonas sp.]
MHDTLANPVRHAQDVRHSRFLALAAPIDGAQAALAFVREVSDPEATHNCWAYRHGSDYRSSDDGEPAGTAGRPILAAIDGQGFDRVVVVVTRWFGGVKLGAGGLVRAYGGTAAECLRQAPRLPLVPMRELALYCGFDDIGVVHALLPTHAAVKLEETFDAGGMRMHIQLPADRENALKTRLRDATRNRIGIDEERIDE